jgi:DNA-directed RNA polymerase specialized sigma24 family protein
MGAVSVDLEKKGRELDTSYELDSAEGVKMLLENIYKLKERRFYKADFDASTILLDLSTAVAVARKQRALVDRLTDRQWECTSKVLIEGYTYEEASEIFQLSQSTIHEHVEKCTQKLATVFANWEYGKIESRNID